MFLSTAPRRQSGNQAMPTATKEDGRRWFGEFKDVMPGD